MCRLSLNERSSLRMARGFTLVELLVGRGTRLYDGNDYFTIYDFVRAHQHFSDPEWDGEPAKSTEVEPNPVDDGKPLSDPVTNEHLVKLTLLSTRSFQNKASKTKDRPGPTGKAGKVNIYSYSEQRKWFLKHWPSIPADRLPPSHQEAINLIRTNCPTGN